MSHDIDFSHQSVSLFNILRILFFDSFICCKCYKKIQFSVEELQIHDTCYECSEKIQLEEFYSQGNKPESYIFMTGK